jgi:tripartite-type tricarboxylate transporter receptor subunit TctC
MNGPRWSQPFPQNAKWTLKAGLRACAAVAAMAFAFQPLAHAQSASAPPDTSGSGSYPSHVIHIISPFEPGGATDFLARVLSQRMGAALKQTVIVDNRPGANGVIGSSMVAKAAPDGYTLLLGTVGTHGINAAIYEKLPFDTLRDFAPISMIARTPMILVANPGTVRANNARELIAEMKAAKNPYLFSSAGKGSVGNAAAELFKELAHVNLTHVPYKGTAPAVLGLLSGEVQLTFTSPVAAAAYVKTGKLKIIGSAAGQRSVVDPETPTLAEEGVTGFDVSTWYGLFAPAKTPPAIVEYLSATMRRVLNDPQVKQQLLSQSLQAAGDTPADFTDQVRREVARWAPLASVIR